MAQLADTLKSIQALKNLKKNNKFVTQNHLEIEEIAYDKDSVIVSIFFHEFSAPTTRSRSTCRKNTKNRQFFTKLECRRPAPCKPKGAFQIQLYTSMRILKIMK